jgi:hypothetical protein
MRLLLRGSFPLFFLFLISIPALAQETASRDEQMRQVQKQLDQLTAEIERLRQQLRDLQPEGTVAPEEDLTKVDVLEPTGPALSPEAAPQEQAQPPDTGVLTDVGLVPNVPSPGASKVFNPDISAIGNFVGFAGSNPVDEGPAAEFDEAEFGFEAFVDPYAKARFFLAVTPEEVEIEEGYINFITLPYELTAKVGKFRGNFGKANMMHTHQRPWVDVPMVIDRFFGGEGLGDSGVSVSKIFSNPWNAFTEGTLEIMSGDAEGVFEPEQRSDLSYLAHLKLFKDITENSNIEVGTSYARGRLPEVGGSNQFGGIDVTFRYKPLERAIYNSFISRTEIFLNDRNDQSERAVGLYTSADYQFARRWFAGLRLDQVDMPDAPEVTDRSASFTVTFWPSEFSQIRGQFRHIDFDLFPSADELLLQVQFSIGAHGAHIF